MTPRTMTYRSRSARGYRYLLTANVAAMYAKTITFEAFSAENRRLWDEISARNLSVAVNHLIRMAERTA